MTSRHHEVRTARKAILDTGCGSQSNKDIVSTVNGFPGHVTGDRARRAAIS